MIGSGETSQRVEGAVLAGLKTALVASTSMTSTEDGAPFDDDDWFEEVVVDGR